MVVPFREAEEAKALGIAMASPAFMMRDLIDKHKVAVFSSNYTLYGDMSARIMETLSALVPGVEMYSIDEAFLDLHALSSDGFAGTGISHTAHRYEKYRHTGFDRYGPYENPGQNGQSSCKKILLRRRGFLGGESRADRGNVVGDPG